MRCPFGCINSQLETRNPQLPAHRSLFTAHCFCPQITQISGDCFAFPVLRFALTLYCFVSPCSTVLYTE